MSAALTDKSPMPFGTYRGVDMEKVPASYLLWLWDKPGGLWDENTLNSPSDWAVHDYIDANFHALETECKDLIIEHRP
jgi:hypothetical protein